MSEFTPTPRSRVRHLPRRARYDKATIYAILDAGLVAHVGFVDDSGGPVVIPVLYARRGDELIVHGARGGRLQQHLAAGHEVSVSVALVDGLVLAKSAFNQSVNYRSVVLFGRGRALTSPEEKLDALRVLTEHILPGQWAYVRPPTPKELNATGVAAITILEAAAKMRQGPPGDAEQDQDLPLWAGVLPTALAFGAPQPAAHARGPLPPHVQAFLARQPRLVEPRPHASDEEAAP